MRAVRSVVTPLLAVTIAATLAACAEPLAVPAASSRQPAELAAARTPANPNTRWQFYADVPDAVAGSVPAGITGDSRRADGTALTPDEFTGEYQGGLCGARADLQLASGSGDSTFDPDMSWSAKTKCPRRTVLFSTASGLTQADPAPFANARGVTALSSIGDTNERWDERGRFMQWTVGKPGCDRLRFRDVLIARVGTTTTGKAVWDVRTTNHTATCLTPVGSELVETTETYVLPYHILITEI